MWYAVVSSLIIVGLLAFAAGEMYGSYYEHKRSHESEYRTKYFDIITENINLNRKLSEERIKNANCLCKLDEPEQYKTGYQDGQEDTMAKIRDVALNKATINE